MTGKKEHVFHLFDVNTRCRRVRLYVNALVIGEVGAVLLNPTLEQQHAKSLIIGGLNFKAVNSHEFT